MADDFAKAVEDGLRLSKRLYFGKDQAAAPHRPSPELMERSPSRSLLPTAPMVYAVIYDPAIVDNPDIPSYQPYVHGRCDQALIPLQMHGVELEADCHLDTALVRVSGSWRVHCVMGSKSCACRIAVPMGEQVRSFNQIGKKKKSDYYYYYYYKFGEFCFGSLSFACDFILFIFYYWRWRIVGPCVSD